LADLVEAPWLLPSFDSVIGGSLIAEVFRSSGLELPQKVVAAGAVLDLQSLVIDGDFLAFYPSSPLRLGAIGRGVKVLPVHLHNPPSPFGRPQLPR